MACTGIIYAATTVGNNITTGGTLTATGLATLGNASSTLFSIGNSAYIGGSSGLILSDGSMLDASGSISFGDENISTTGALSISGLATLGNASTTQLSVSGNSWLAATTVGGDLSVTGDLTMGGYISNGSILLPDINPPTGLTITANNAAGTLSADTYYYTIYAFDADWNYSASSLPMSCTVSGGTSQCELSWTASSDAVNYGIYRETAEVFTGVADAPASGTVLTDAESTFTSTAGNYGAAQAGDYAINNSDQKSCKITAVAANSVTCSGSVMAWSAGDSFTILRIKDAARRAIAAAPTVVYTDSSAGSLGNALSGMPRVLSTTGAICIGSRCDDDISTLETLNPALLIDQSNTETQGAAIQIRTGNPTESFAGLAHRSGVMAQCEDIGGGTASMACGVFTAERNQTGNLSINYGVWGRYNQASASFTNAASPVAGVYGSAGSNSVATLTINDVAGVLGAIDSSNSNATITQGSAFYADNRIGTGLITNQYGMIIEEPTGGGTGNYGLWLNGDCQGPSADSGCAIIFGDGKEGKLFNNGTTLNLLYGTGIPGASTNIALSMMGTGATFQSTENSPASQLLTLQNNQAPAANVGAELAFATTGATRTGTIDVILNDATTNNAYMAFSVKKAGTLSELLRLTAYGTVRIPATADNVDNGTPDCEDGDIYYDSDGDEGMCLCVSGIFYGMLVNGATPDCN